MTYEDLEELTEHKGLPYVLGLLANIADNAAEYSRLVGEDKAQAYSWVAQATAIRQAIRSIELLGNPDPSTIAQRESEIALCDEIINNLED